MSADEDAELRMAVAIHAHLDWPDQWLVYKALCEVPERLCVLLAPYGGAPVTDSEFAALMLRISKRALTPDGTS